MVTFEYLESLIILALISTIFISLVLKLMRKSLHDYPPGPSRLSLLRNIHNFDTAKVHIYLWELSNKYGKIMSLRFGSKTRLAISSAKLAKQVMKTQAHAFSGRPSTIVSRKLSYNQQDILFSPYNDCWRELRKICTLHLFSLKKVQSFSPIRENEVLKMIKKLEEQASLSQITNLSQVVMSTTSNMLFRVAFGLSYDEEAQERKRFNELLQEAQLLIVGFFVADYFPSLGWIDKLSGMMNRLDKNFNDLDSFYEELIEKHLNPQRPKSMEGDILDLLLRFKKELSTPMDLSLENIKGLLMNILSAGTETGAASIIWTMTALLNSPNSMKKVQSEIRTSIGKKDIVNEEDIQKLPYFKAVIKEALRLFPPIPILGYESSEKCSLDGYEIEPQTVLYINAWAIARDPEYWKNPEEFMPERFLNINSDIDFRRHDFEFIPFGAGKRGCPGLSLGLVTIELVLVNLLYAFDWDLPCGMKNEQVDTHALPGLAMRKKNDLCLVPKQRIVAG